MDHYTIHIKFKERDFQGVFTGSNNVEIDMYKALLLELNGEYEIVEETAFCPSTETKILSFATIRKGVVAPLASGATWLNPNDRLDYDSGKRTAFKRAVEQLVFNLYMGSLQDFIVKLILQKFRNARYHSLKGNNK